MFVGWANRTPNFSTTRVLRHLNINEPSICGVCSHGDSELLACLAYQANKRFFQAQITFLIRETDVPHNYIQRVTEGINLLG
jgi:hypothetical protein